MSSTKILVKALFVLACLFMLAAPPAWAGSCEGCCWGDFDYDGDVDGRDVAWFKSDAGRQNCTCDPAPVPNTGQTTSYADYDDGYYETGVVCECISPRFTDNEDGTVTDNLTGLMWTKDANLPGGSKNWQEALDYVADMNAGTYENFGFFDWRLPNVRELLSLIHYGFSGPALPDTEGCGRWVEGDPFNNVEFHDYWSSTTYAFNTGLSWRVSMNAGYSSSGIRDTTLYVWPVRGGIH